MAIEYPLFRIKEEAARVSESYGNSYIGIEHALLALLKLNNSFFNEILYYENSNVKKFEISKIIDESIPKSTEYALKKTEQTKSIQKIFNHLNDSNLNNEEDFIKYLFETKNDYFFYCLAEAQINEFKLQKSIFREHILIDEEDYLPQIPELNKLGRNITILAKQNKLFPHTGREKEILKICRIMSSFINRNPLIVGHPGVGKTALVEGFAQFLISDKCPPGLKKKKIIEISVTDIMTNTKYVSELETKMAIILKELKDNPDIILFIDEIHRLVGAGTYENNNSNDIANIIKPALARGEINIIGATTLSEYKKHIEKDLAFVRRFKQIFLEEPSIEESIKILDIWVSKLDSENKMHISEQALRETVYLCKEYISIKKLPNIAIEILDETIASAKLENKNSINEIDVKQTISRITDIDFLNLNTEKKEIIEKLDVELRKNIISQENAITHVINKIYKGYANLENTNLPLAVFMFYGPSGVGKTYLARTLAKNLFGTDKKFLRINMSEYNTPDSISNLKGSSRGLVGSDEGGILVEFVKRNPYSIILLDEIEKACMPIWQYFLSAFDTDPHLLDMKTEEKISAKNIIFIMTTNVLSQIEIGFEIESDTNNSGASKDDKIIKALKDCGFSIELLNRIQNFIEFKELNFSSIQEISKIKLNELKNSLTKNNIELTWNDDLIKLLGKICYKKGMGARPLNRYIEDNIVIPLSIIKINEPIDKNIKILLSIENDQIKFITQI